MDDCITFKTTGMAVCGIDVHVSVFCKFYCSGFIYYIFHIYCICKCLICAEKPTCSQLCLPHEKITFIFRQCVLDCHWIMH